ncbi:hypothetical protein Pla52o_46340 [Novipirellula galeiformis]|uniref:Uncharacterized protein n=1 Tax=Novipirellula galeiformis TaxID=2528004 RepID=A0A5C6C650_9BACT|nr:hypothetical protein [Novipirellula galeiformis]TWU20120.1 hypothetical protein Pla52o_46340 [Novipirellula galeiformis]
MEGYAKDVELQMRHFFDSLSEKDRRRYAAVEAAKLGHGGVTYLAGLFGCHPDTIRQGRADVENLPADAAESRIRKRGAVAAMLAAQNQGSSMPFAMNFKPKLQDRR